MKHIKKFDESANQPAYQAQQPGYQTQQPNYQTLQTGYMASVPEYEEELENKIGEGLTEEEYREIAIKRTRAFYNIKQVKDDMKDILHLLNWILEDFQLDPRSDNYFGHVSLSVDGFSNTEQGHKLNDALKILLKHKELSLLVMDSVGLETKGNFVESETIIGYKR